MQAYCDLEGKVPAQPGDPVARLVVEAGEVSLVFVQPALARRPCLVGYCAGKAYLVYDGVDDALTLLEP